MSDLFFPYRDLENKVYITCLSFNRMKKKVIEFFVILLFITLLLMTIQYIRFGSLTGLIAFDEESVYFRDSNQELETGISLYDFQSDLGKFKKGESKTVELKVVNDGRTFLNDCRIFFPTSLLSWFESSESIGLSVFEKHVFNINVKIPSNIDSGDYEILIYLVCEEYTSKERAVLTVLEQGFQSQIRNYEREENNLVIYYSLEEFEGKDREMNVNYELVDLDGDIVVAGREEIVLGANSKGEYVLQIDLPKNSFGEFDLEMEFESRGVIEKESEKIFLPSRGVSGLAIFGENSKRWSVYAFVFVLIVVGFIFIMRLTKRKKSTGDVGVRFGKRPDRKTIRFDLK